MHYEIMQNFLPTNEKPFVVESELIREGRRDLITYKNTKELLAWFPDLKEWETVLYAYEQIKMLQMKIYKLERELDNYKGDALMSD
jgi:hypothetical protein